MSNGFGHRSVREDYADYEGECNPQQKCSADKTVILTVDTQPPIVQKWFCENTCKLVKIAEAINTNIEAYNKLVDSYNKIIDTVSAPYFVMPIKVGNYNFDEFFTTVESLFPLVGEYVEPTGIFGMAAEGWTQTFGVLEWMNWVPYSTILQNTLAAGRMGFRCREGNNGHLTSIEKAWNDVDQEDKWEDEWAAAFEANKSIGTTEQKAACKIWNDIYYKNNSDSAMHQLGLKITELARELKELWDSKDEVIKDEIDLTNLAIADFEEQGDAESLAAAEQAAALLAAMEDLQADISAAAATATLEGFDKMAFSEQCFLLAKIFDLTNYKKLVLDTQNPPRKKLPYYPNEDSGNACLMVEGDSYALVNRLTQHPAQAAFFDIKTEEISNLQPMIRLYKIIMENDEEVQQEFMFDSHASRKDVESLFSNTAKRGFGVGIKDFSFTYDGSNPFAAKKSIKAKLQIFASSFDELLVERGPADKPYKYADLALKTGTSADAKSTAGACKADPVDYRNSQVEENLKKLHFRLKAVVGWARPSGDTSIFTTKTATGKGKIMDAINESYITLNLTPTTHEFNIDEMGRVSFTVNYLAYIEDFFDQSQFDIFFEPHITRRELVRKFKHKYLSESGDCTEEYSDVMAKWKEELGASNIIQKDKNLNMQSLMKRLGVFGEKEGVNGKIKYINLTNEEISEFNKKGPFFQRESVMGKITESPSSQDELIQEILENFMKGEALQGTDEEAATKRKNQLELDLKASGIGNPSIGFFYVSDLIDVILEGIEKRLALLQTDRAWNRVRGGLESVAKEMKKDFDENLYNCFKENEISEINSFHRAYKRFRVLLGPLELVKSNPEREPVGISHVNFGDLPISTKYFMEWMTEKLVGREQTQYSLNSFLSDFFKDLVKEFLNNDTCFTPLIKQKTVVNQAVVTSYKEANQSYDEITKWIVEYPYKKGYGGWHFSRARVDEMLQPILNISGPHGRDSTSPIIDSGIENEINYLVFYAARTQPSELQNGSRTQDETRGINHYIIGRPTGIVKNISLAKTDSKSLQMVRFEQEGFDGLQQLREVYNVDIDCFANVKAFPGTYIFVDPRGWAPNAAPYGAESDTDLTRYGIGGYCMITRSEHTFQPGKADSKITAKWVAGIDDGSATPSSQNAGDNSRKKKCST